MPKAKARKPNKAQGKATPKASRVALANETRPSGGQIWPPTGQRPKAQSVQGLVMYAMVALGCWGFAASFLFFTTDPNRYLYGGMAALMALMWSLMFGMRLRKSMVGK